MSDESTINDVVDNEQDRPTSPNRRRILTAATLPVIATLPSGAALARSSNLVRVSTFGGGSDAFGRTLCLDTRHVESAGHNTVDLGEPPYAEVTAITDRDYREIRNSRRVSEAQMCREGGRYRYQQAGRWNQVQLRRGMLVSATALSSFGGAINVTEI